MQNHLAQYNVEELQSYLSDFHKDFFGFRPRYATPEQWRDREYLEAAINAIHNTMDEMKETLEGRAELRAQGWEVNESDFDVLEQAEESANADAVYYGA
jgi:predicted deacylase